MIELNDFTIQLNNIFVIFFNILSSILTTHIPINNHIDCDNSYISLIQLLLLFCINNIYLLQKLLVKIKETLKLIQINKINLVNKITNIEQTLNKNNTEILFLYNSISIKNNNRNNLNFILLKKINFNFNKQLSSNLELYSLDNLENNFINDDDSIDPLITYNNNNFLGYKKVNIGFNNYYNLHSYQYLRSDLPLNLLIYVKELDQVIIKLGINNKFKYINSKLYKVYNTFDNQLDHKTNNINNFYDYRYNSILCNNNIKELNKKCYTENCKYYHDYILGYTDNYHKTRYFSSNPIVYNCPTFKDGSQIKENKKKIPWYNAINLYQSSLSNLLIACIHAEYYDNPQ